MNQIVVASNLHLANVEKLEGAVDLTDGCKRGGGLLRSGEVALSTLLEKHARGWSTSTPVLILLVALSMWAFILTGAVVFLLHKVQSQGSQTMASPLLSHF